jgi:hypothetical protein
MMLMLPTEINICRLFHYKIKLASVLQTLGNVLYLVCPSDNVEIRSGFCVLGPTLGSSGVEHQ